MKDKNNWPFRLVGALLLLWITVESALLVVYRETWFDELVYLFKGYTVVTGAFSPFRDIILEYPPLAFFTHGVVQALVGPSMIAGRLTSAVFFAVMLLLTFSIGRNLGGRLAGFGAVALVMSHALLVANYLSAVPYALTVAFLLGALAVEFSLCGRNAKSFWAGLLLAGMMLTRINMLAAVLIYGAYLFWIRLLPRHHIIFWGVFVSAGVIGYLPIILPDPALALSSIAYPFARTGLLAALPVSLKVGGVSAEKFLEILASFFREYAATLAFFSAIWLAIAYRACSEDPIHREIAGLRARSPGGGRAVSGDTARTSRWALQPQSCDCSRIWGFRTCSNWRREMKDFFSREREFTLLTAMAVGLLAAHYFYWRITGSIQYANFFMPLAILTAVIGAVRYFKKEKVAVVLTIAVIGINLFANAFPSGIISRPREETDLERVKRGAALVAAHSDMYDRIIAFDNSIFHVFVAGRTTEPALINRDFLYARGIDSDTAWRLRMYNSEILMAWLAEADIVLLHEERWRQTFRRPFWKDENYDGEKVIAEVASFIDGNYVLIGKALNVYPRKYTEGNDGGTLLIYRRKK